MRLRDELGIKAQLKNGGREGVGSELRVQHFVRERAESALGLYAYEEVCNAAVSSG